MGVGAGDGEGVGGDGGEGGGAGVVGHGAGGSEAGAAARAAVIFGHVPRERREPDSGAVGFVRRGEPAEGADVDGAELDGGGQCRLDRDDRARFLQCNGHREESGWDRNGYKHCCDHRPNGSADGVHQHPDIEQDLFLPLGHAGDDRAFRVYRDE